MAKLIPVPTLIPVAGEPPKIIEELIGRVNSEITGISIAKMTIPSGCREPEQTRIDEYTVMLKGELRVETRIAVHKVLTGQATAIHAGEWVRYSAQGGSREETIRDFRPSDELEIQIPQGREVTTASLLKAA
jgi:hypothetical protein